MTIVSRRAVAGDHDGDDATSHCGSISGHSFASKKYRNSCTLRKHQVDAIAHRLRGLSEDKCQQDGSKEEPTKRFNSGFHSYRFFIACLGGFAAGSMILLRYSISVAIISMVNQTALYVEEHPNKTIDDFLAEGYSLGGEFDWSNEIQQMIMSWYMFAYTLPQLPCTKLCLMIGIRKAIPMLLIICALSNLLTPPAAYLGWQWVLVLRLVQGVGASGILPLQLKLIENWMPYEELSIGLTCVILVPAAFIAITPIFMGYLCDIGWSYTFYVPGVITILFACLWYLLVTDRPDENWMVSEQELALICGCSNTGNGLDKHTQKHHHEVADLKQANLNTKIDGKTTADVKEEPAEEKYQATWLDPLKIPSFYAFLTLWCLHCTAINDFIFILPNYLRQVLKIGVKTNGIYCSVIQIGSIISVIWPHPFLRILQNRFKLSLTASRRITYVVVTFMVGGTWAFIGIFHQHQLVLLSLNRCFHSTTDILVTGSIMSNYAKEGISSLAYSMVNTIGNLSVVATSTLIGYYLDKTGQSIEAWSWIFIAGGVTQLIMLIVFNTMIDSNPVTIKRKSRPKQLSA